MPCPHHMQPSPLSLTYPCPSEYWDPGILVVQKSLEQSASILGIPLVHLAETMLPSFGHSQTCPIIGSGRFVVSPCSSHEGHHLVMWLKLLRAAETKQAVLNKTAALELPHPLLADPKACKDALARAAMKPCRSMDEMLNGSFTGPLTGRGDDWPLSHIWEPHSGCMVASLRPMHAVPLLHERGIRRCATRRSQLNSMLKLLYAF